MTRERRAWAYLSRVAEPPCLELAALVGCVGPQEAADRVRRGLVSDDLARHTEARRETDRAAEDLELLADEFEIPLHLREEHVLDGSRTALGAHILPHQPPQVQRAHGSHHQRLEQYAIVAGKRWP